MGWSLNAGGVITRTVVDEPDEWTNTTPPEDMSELSYLAANYIEKAVEKGFDNQPDNFSYNFNGHSGKFIYDRVSKSFIQIPNEKLKITTFEESDKSGFKIITPNGVAYIFLDIETSKNIQSGQNCGKTIDIHTPTAWYLSRIEHPSGDKIIFKYKNNSYSYFTGVSQTLSRPLNFRCFSDENCCSQSHTTATCFKEVEIHSKTLEYIENEDVGKIWFVSSKTRKDVNDFRLDRIDILKSQDLNKPVKSFSFSYEETDHSNSEYKNKIISAKTLNHRLFLINIIEKGMPPYQFDYVKKSELPPRLSYAQDFWGYFNGKVNDYFVTMPPLSYMELFPVDLSTNRMPDAKFSDIGVIKSITYPTGSKSIFSYEPNTYLTKEIKPATIQPNSLFVNSMDDGSLTMTNEIFAVEKDQLVDFIFHLRFCDYADNCEIGMDAMVGNVEIRDNDDNKVISKKLEFKIPEVAQSGGEPISKEEKFSVNLKNDKFYYLTLNVKGSNMKSFLSYDLELNDQQEINVKKELGGIRVSKISHSDDKNTRKFYYNTYQNRSSANPVFIKNQRYYEKIRYKICDSEIACNDFDCFQLNLHSSSLITQFNAEGHSVYYPNVTISYGDNFENGGIQYKFVANKDGSNYVLWGKEYIAGSPNANLSWENGKKLQEIHFKVVNEEMIKIKDIEYEYDALDVNVSKGFVIRKVFEPCCSKEIVLSCDENKANEYWQYEYCAADHHHWYRVGEVCSRSDKDIRKVRIDHPCSSGNKYIIDPNAREMYNVIGYDIFSVWKPLKRKIIKTYDINGLNEVMSFEDLYYENPEHGLVTKKVNAGNRIVKTIFKYPLDYNEDVQKDNPFVQSLIDNNRIGEPIEVQKWTEDKLIEGTLLKYDDLLKDSLEVFSLESYNPLDFEFASIPYIDLLPNLPDDASYRKTRAIHFNKELKPIEVRKTDDIPTTYIYGFNYTLPVAEIVGIGYEEAIKMVNPAKIQGLDGDELRNELNKLRGLEGAMVTTFTYEPLVGMTSMTDENGRTTHYVYDDFGRLKYTTDHNDNIIQTYKYHYAGHKD